MVQPARINLRRLFPNVNARSAARIQQNVRRLGLPMVNAGGRVDLNVLLMSGARTGIFVDLRDFSQDVADKISLSEDAQLLSVRKRVDSTAICFRYHGDIWKIFYYATDAKNMDLVLKKQRIAFYYTALQAGPELIPNAGFDALVKGGYLVSPLEFKDPRTCLKITGLKKVTDLRKDLEMDFIDGVLYKKVRTMDKVSAPDEPTLEVYVYLRDGF